MVLVDVGAQAVFWSAGMLGAAPTEPGAPAAIHARVLEAFRDWPNPVPAMLAATDPHAIIERPLVDRPPLTRWSVGRVTLLGDAAHPMVPALGQGANTAFEDAVELAHCLTTAPSIEGALTTYEAGRLPRTQVIQARSATQGSRAYDPDSERYLRGVAEQAQIGQDAFEQWLYGYRPGAVR